MKKGINKDINKNIYLWVILGCFVILLIPIGYYFLYALPKHNEALEKIEYEKFQYEKEKAEQKERQERLEKEEKQRQEQERIRMEQEKKQKYEQCLWQAEYDYNVTNLKRFCNLGYDACVQEVKEYNANLTQKYDYWGNSNERSINDCAKLKYTEKDGVGTCMMSNNYSQLREKEYERALDQCEKTK